MASNSETQQTANSKQIESVDRRQLLKGGLALVTASVFGFKGAMAQAVEGDSEQKIEKNNIGKALQSQILDYVEKGTPLGQDLQGAVTVNFINFCEMEGVVGDTGDMPLTYQQSLDLFQKNPEKYRLKRFTLNGDQSNLILTIGVEFQENWKKKFRQEKD